MEYSQQIPIETSNFLQHKNEPSMGFSPDRSRFENSVTNRTSSAASIDIDLFLHTDHRIESNPVQDPVSGKPGQLPEPVGTGNGTRLQKRLERHIAHANKINESASNGKLKVDVPASPTHTMIPSGSDSRSKALLPPERLAVPRKPSNISSHLLTQEAKPLVQWDTEDSEEELSFFPECSSTKKRRLTDNLSVDNLSLLSGEEEDLHLTPPRLRSPGLCPCDPRPLVRHQLTRLRRSQPCTIV